MGSLIGAICGATAGLLWLLIRLTPRDWLAIYKDGISIVYIPFLSCSALLWLVLAAL